VTEMEIAVENFSDELEARGITGMGFAIDSAGTTAFSGFFADEKFATMVAAMLFAYSDDTGKEALFKILDDVRVELERAFEFAEAAKKWRN